MSRKFAMRRYRRGKRSVGAAVLAVLALAGLLVSCGKTVLARGPGERTGELVRGGPAGRYLVPQGIHKIKHVIVVMQENRSFDEYFGTYPGADGLPRKDGRFAACMPDPRGGCTRRITTPRTLTAAARTRWPTRSATSTAAR